MLRRSFLQSIIAGISALFVPKTQAKENLQLEDEHDLEVGNDFHGDFDYNPCDFGSISFPEENDEIVSMVNYRDTVIIACAHSVWQFDYDNEGFPSFVLISSVPGDKVHIDGHIIQL